MVVTPSDRRRIWEHSLTVNFVMPQRQAAMSLTVVVAPGRFIRTRLSQHNSRPPRSLGCRGTRVEP